MRCCHVAYSGATTTNILDHGQHGFPAQIQAVTPDTRLVTILIGGNDVSYVGNLGALTCQDTGGSNCKVVPDAEVDRRLAALPASLRAVIDQVKDRAPHAQVILVGYLPVIPASGPGTCDAVPLTAADASRMRDVAVRLAQAIGSTSSHTDASVVRATVIGTGHDACAPAAYVAGAHPACNPAWPSAVPYHPNQQGMDRVAEAISEMLGR